MSLKQIQKEQHLWSMHNFGFRDPVEPLLGVQEEVGELSHAHLKYLQKIRNTTREVFELQAKDAIGDIVIFLMDYCNSHGWDLEEIVSSTWDVVKQRDWKKFPKNGVTA